MHAKGLARSKGPGVTMHADRTDPIQYKVIRDSTFYEKPASYDD